jgi:phospholipid/cholesterol/gamma-HCH transport system substrate-binding protein
MSSPTPTGRKVHYVHRLEYTTLERLVGAFVLGALLLLLVLFVYSREARTLFADKFTIIAYMRNAQSITTDTKVQISGIEVGEVRAIDLGSDNLIRVEMRVLEKFHGLVREDSRASLSKLSMIGKATLEVSAGDTAQGLVPDGGIVPVDEPVSIDQIMADVLPALRDAQTTLERMNALAQAVDPKDVQRAMRSATVTADNLEKLTTMMAQGRGGIGQMVADKGVEQDLAITIKSLASTLQQTEARMRELAPVFKDLQSMSSDARNASKDLPQLMEETHKLVGQLNTTVGTVNYEMQQLPDLVLKTRQLMEQTDRTLRALQGTWPISNSVAQPPDKELVEPRPSND